MLSSEKGMSDFAKQIHNLTDYNIPTPVKEQNKVIDEIVNVATNGEYIHFIIGSLCIKFTLIF